VDILDAGMDADPARPAGRRRGRAGRGDGAPDDGGAGDGSAAAYAVTALYREHAVGLVRLAIIMLGDRAAAEDVVQDAFLGLYRNWRRLADPANALAYTRSAVLNRCRNALRDQARRGHRDQTAGVDASLNPEGAQGSSAQPGGRLATAQSAESAVLLTEDSRRMLAVVRRLPDRQREVIVLRYYLDMSEEEAATAMGVSRGTIKSSTSRAVAALGRLLLKEVS
jgi:RNA polymerase sigma factor (sigma-70 family)